MSSRYCDGYTRRDLLKVGGLSALSFGLADYLRLAQAGEVKETNAKSAIFIYLGGGPTHLDSFDMKPDAPAEIRGDFKPSATKVPGVQICEHLPRLAQCANLYTIIRGVSHTLAGHELGTSYLNTGNRPIPSLLYPGYGAVVSKEIAGPADVPPYIAVPTTPQQAGYLGVRYAPLQTQSTPVAGQPYSVRGIVLGGGLTVEQFEKRQNLKKQLDSTFQSLEKESRLLDGLEQFDRQAFAVITSTRTRQAFDISQEKPAVAETFGTHKFGLNCLLSLRLIEAGVRFATVTFSGWDTHSGNFRAAKENLLPALDQGLSALLTQLQARGLLASTAIYVTGEFGRTPKINDKAGRDHWPRAMFVLLAGGKVRVGQALGASDAKGMGPAQEPITPEQVAASFYHNLGIDYRQEYHTHTGRPVQIVREGGLIKGLFS